MKLAEICEGIQKKMMNSEDDYSEIYNLVDLVVIQEKILGKKVATVVLEKDPNYGGWFKVSGNECSQYFEDELDDMADIIRDYLVSEGFAFERVKPEYTDEYEWEILVYF
jgi:hypothetical protein